MKLQVGFMRRFDESFRAAKQRATHVERNEDPLRFREIVRRERPCDEDRALRHGQDLLNGAAGRHGKLESLPIGGNANVDQCLGALTHTLAIECRHPELRHHIMHMVTGGDHTRAMLEHRHNFTDHGAITQHCSAGESDNRHPTFGTGGAVREIQLPANGRILPWPDTIRTDLAGQIHFQCRVDRHHPVILRNDKRVVDVFGPVQFNQRVVVHPFVQALGAQDEPGHNLAGMNILPRIRYNARFHQIDHAIREQFGVNAQVLLAIEMLEDCVRDGANAQLHGGTVGDQPGNMRRHFFDNNLIALLPHGMFADRAIDRNDVIHTVDVHCGITQAPRHLLVYLGNDSFGRFGSRYGEASF